MHCNLPLGADVSLLSSTDNDMDSFPEGYAK